MSQTHDSPTDEPLATIIPRPNADVCGAVGCHERENLTGIDPNGPEADRRTLCPEHFTDYLEDIEYE